MAEVVEHLSDRVASLEQDIGGDNKIWRALEDFGATGGSRDDIALQAAMTAGVRVEVTKPGVFATPVTAFPHAGIRVAKSGQIKGNLYNKISATTITNVTNATPMRVTAAGHQASTDNVLTISGVGGCTSANVRCRVVRIDANTIDLYDASTGAALAGNGAYTAGGQVNAATTLDAIIVYTTAGKATSPATTVAATRATTLNGAYSASAESIAVNGDVSAWPTINFWIQIGTEVMWCFLRSTNTLYVDRGAEGTIAASHSNNDAVSQIPQRLGTTLTVADPTNIAAGVWIYVVPGAIGYRGAYYLVKSVSGSVVTVDEPILWNYVVGDTVYIYATDPTLSDFVIECEGRDELSGPAFTGKCVTYTDLVGTRSCLVRGFRGAAIDANIASDAGVVWQEGRDDQTIDLRIDGSGGNCADKGLAVIAAERHVASDYSGKNLPNYGAGINDCMGGTFERFALYGCGTGLVLGTETGVSAGGFFACRDVKLKTITSQNNTGDGIVFTSGTSDCILDGFAADGNGGKGVNVTGFAHPFTQIRNQLLSGHANGNVDSGIAIGDGTYNSRETQLGRVQARRNGVSGLLINAASTGTTGEGIGAGDNQSSDIRGLAGFHFVNVQIDTRCASVTGIIGLDATDDYYIHDLNITARAGANAAVGVIRGNAGSPRLRLGKANILLKHNSSIAIWNAGSGDFYLDVVRATNDGVATGTVGLECGGGTTRVGPGCDFSGVATASEGVGALDIDGDVLSFSGSFAGAVGAVSAYFANAGVVVTALAAAQKYPRGKKTGFATLEVSAVTNTLTTATSVTVYKNGSATSVLVSVTAATTGVFAFSGPLALAVGDYIDLRADDTGGGATNSLALSATLTLG